MADVIRTSTEPVLHPLRPLRNQTTRIYAWRSFCIMLQCMLPFLIANEAGLLQYAKGQVVGRVGTFAGDSSVGLQDGACSIATFNQLSGIAIDNGGSMMLIVSCSSKDAEQANAACFVISYAKAWQSAYFCALDNFEKSLCYVVGYDYTRNRKVQ